MDRLQGIEGLHELDLGEVRGKLYKYIKNNDKGIYFLSNADRRILYIGQSMVLRQRIQAHLTEADYKHNYQFIQYILVEDDIERDEMERGFIYHIDPIFNEKGRRGFAKSQKKFYRRKRERK
ncbi:GIY-YIG nuclease family protein [Fictibacillus sp. WQ 8-8]|uniref:GIY-YIG nuclease family protein n=1 Tax=Fictibacillus sp. WQ 8-8 TaxID=2938788 RepID=UPI00210EFD51|nr:GIY-YIG nuclease family protein [Fictibacillus sp. WQ 8-8]MCQ6264513.1 GIY-YIG nuclease family protein [Fictibacillus sp. WQ 8-8]